MGIFKGEKPNTKEFMKYEDGKIVSIEVEQAPKPKPIEHYPIEEKTKEKQPRINVVKRYMTKEVLKKIAMIVILILLVYALYDVYKAFFTSPDSTTVPPQSNGSVTTPSTPKPTTSTPSNETPVETPPSTPVVEDNETTGKTPTVDEEPFAYLLSLTNQLNASMIALSSEELEYIGRYEDRQANKIGLQKHLTSSQAEKEKLYATLATFESLFADEDLSELYTATVNRLQASIQFTKDANASFSSSQSISNVADDYITTDESLRLEQQKKLTDALNKVGIPYTINEATKNVEYTIPKQ